MKWFWAFKYKWTPWHERAAPQGEPFVRLALLTSGVRDLFLLFWEGYTLKKSAKQPSLKYPMANTHMMGVYKN